MTPCRKEHRSAGSFFFGGCADQKSDYDEALRVDFRKEALKKATLQIIFCSAVPTLLNTGHVPECDLTHYFTLRSEQDIRTCAQYPQPVGLVQDHRANWDSVRVLHSSVDQ
ncbi:MAG: hypothetical protein H7Z75_12080 [Ferruginibacter sp.]|nr:hypothetical protein [Cytophagales bacterium]